MKPVLAALLLGSVALPVAAQEGLTPVSLKTYAYDSVLSWGERDMRPLATNEIVAVAGKVILDIRAVFDVPWTDELQRLNVSSSDIRLILPDGTELQGFGAYEYWGMFHPNPQGVSISRPRGYPDEDEDLYWHSMFLVPAGTTTATLVIPGEPGFRGEVTVPATGPEQDPASFAEFAVRDVDRLRSVALEDGSDSRFMTSTIAAPAGHVFVDLEIAVSPLSANDFDPEGRFYFHTYDFRLSDGAGATWWPLGERFMKRVLDWQFNSVAVGDTGTRRMIWIVPEGATGAVLHFGESPVATVELSGPIMDQG